MHEIIQKWLESKKKDNFYPSGNIVKYNYDQYNQVLSDLIQDLPELLKELELHNS